MLPEDARLAHDLLALRQWAAALEAAGNTQQASDLADVILLVQGHSFRLVWFVVASSLVKLHRCITQVADKLHVRSHMQ